MAESGDAAEVLDLSDKNLKKLEKSSGKRSVHTLILDKNSLSRLDSVESYGTNIYKLSAADNDLVRMYGVAKLNHLQILNLSENNIVCIEGMRELTHLKWLNLAGNNIKNIDHLLTNLKLEHLDLSDNNITHISDVSHLKALKTLLLHKNKISTLRYANNYLPQNIHIFSVSENNLTDINEISYLSSLATLEQLSIVNNPCFIMTGENVGFDYRPFVINWCLHLRVLDGYVVGPKESLKAEWLYSQGKGRHFRTGEHSQVVAYLAQVCPMTTVEDLQTEEDAKLARILNKQKQHQLQLLEELSRSPQSASPVLSRASTNRPDQSPSPSLRRKPMRKASPKSLGNVAQRSSSKESSKRASPLRTPTNAASYQMYPVELPAGLYVVGMEGQTRTNAESNAVSTEPVPRPQSLFTKSNTLRSTSATDLMVQSFTEGESKRGLHTESHYVPVPESMLSPDFRPVGTSPPAMYSLANGEAKPSSAPSLSSNRPTRPKGLSPSQNPARTFPRSPSNQSCLYNRGDTHGPASNPKAPQGCQNSPVRPQEKKPGSQLHHTKSLTESPLLRRTAALKKLTKHKMLSLGAAPRKRNLPYKLGLDSPSSGDSLSENESTDSEISLSKLAQVKEIAAARRTKKVIKKSPLKEKANPGIGEKNNKKLNSKVPETLDLDEKEQDTCETQDDDEDGKLDSDYDQFNQEMVDNGSTSAGNPSVTHETEKQDEVHKAATVIQSLWKGYKTRQLDVGVMLIKEQLRQQRTEDHIKQLMSELRKTRQELDQERQLRSVQVETIRALWKEVQLLQTMQANNANSRTTLDEDLKSFEDLKSLEEPAKMDRLLSNNPLLHSMFVGETSQKKSRAQKDHIPAVMSKSVREESSSELKGYFGRRRRHSESSTSLTDAATYQKETSLSFSETLKPSKSASMRTLRETNNEHLGSRSLNLGKLSASLRSDIDSAEVMDNQQTSTMVKQLTRTCEELSSQVLNLQDALHIISKAVFSPDVPKSEYPPPHSMGQSSTASELLACMCRSTQSQLADSGESGGTFPSPVMMSSTVSYDSSLEFEHQGEVLVTCKLSPDVEPRTEPVLTSSTDVHTARKSDANQISEGIFTETSHLSPTANTLKSSYVADNQINSNSVAELCSDTTKAVEHERAVSESATEQQLRRTSTERCSEPDSATIQSTVAAVKQICDHQLRCTESAVKTYDFTLPLVPNMDINNMRAECTTMPLEKILLSPVQEQSTESLISQNVLLKPLSKIGANIPGLTARDTIKSKDEALTSVSNVKKTADVSIASNGKCYTVQVLQAKLIEIQEFQPCDPCLKTVENVSARSPETAAPAEEEIEDRCDKTVAVSDEHSPLSDLVADSALEGSPTRLESTRLETDHQSEIDNVDMEPFDDDSTVSGDANSRPETDRNEGQQEVPASTSEDQDTTVADVKEGCQVTAQTLMAQSVVMPEITDRVSDFKKLRAQMSI